MLKLADIVRGIAGRKGRLKIDEELWPTEGMPNNISISDGGSKIRLSFPYFISGDVMYRLDPRSPNSFMALVEARKHSISCTGALSKVDNISEAAAALTFSGMGGKYTPIERPSI